MDETKLHIELLDRDNYETWRMRVEFALDAKGLGAAIGTGTVDDATDRKARALIGLSVERHLLNVVNEHKKAKEVWLALEGMFKSKSASRKLQLRKELGELKMERTESIAKYLSRAKALYHDMDAVGLKIDEPGVVYALLAGLPNDFKLISNIIVNSAKEEDLTFSTVSPKLLSAEQEVKRTDVNAYVVKNKSNTSGASDSRVCYKCGKHGHIKRNCPDFKKVSAIAL